MTGLSGILLNVHTLLASMSGVKEIAITEPEAVALLKATNDVARHYASGALNQKYVDWAHLFGALGAIYGSRFMMYKARMEQEELARRGNAAKDVTPKPNGAAGAAQADIDLMQAMHHAGQQH